MKKITALLCVAATVLFLCSCGSRSLLPGGDNNGQTISIPDASASVGGNEAVFDYSSVTIELNTGYDTDTYNETATVVAKDKEGNTIWNYECSSYPAMQLDSYTELGKHGANYYLCEGGSLVALDIETGKRVFKNDDFDGYSAKCVFSDDAIYLCGYFGPDFFAVSYDGATLKRIESLSDDYWCAVNLKEKNGKIAVYFDGSDSENGGVLYVDMKTYEVSR